MKRKLRPEKIERVVVRGANWVGDAVMTVPALRALRRVFPRAHLTLATRAWAEGIFEDADFIDDLLVNKRETRGAGAVWGEAREWHARRFDLAVLFPNAFAPALVAALARVPVRVGYAAQGRGLLLTHPLGVPDWRGRRHEAYYYLNIVKELEQLLHGSSNEPGEPYVSLEVSGQRRDIARAMLREHGARLERPLVALCPGSTNSRAKRWPAESFAALADMLIEKACADVVLVGAGEEMDVSSEVARGMRGRPVVLTGKTDLAQTAAILSVADLLVTNDTGPAHVAAAAGCPVIVIFGPTNPLTTRPLSPLAEVVRRPPVCAPCMLRDCPIDHRCMTAITAEEVCARSLAALEARGKMHDSPGKMEVAR
ncbi:MAG TPA: lipopolysaccharide heptosyltransferase II [Pyrinomonadaceae bacterium]|nr:lipopolysaccharide heptosyltransferase II [Pyrinomonadaceae bacterium]